MDKFIYLELASPQLLKCSEGHYSEYVSEFNYALLLFNSICDILNEREQLNNVNTSIANNIAYQEWLISMLQQGIHENGVLEEIENAGNLFVKPNKAIDTIRSLTLSVSKLYKDLRVLPEEIKIEDEDIDELSAFLTRGLDR